ncbi:ankyrin repeat and SOCS box protein 15-like isoform X2 [Engraulis encrasicolus]|uniref:ankyrin repeat and SOCS box protein 15-like isoform X2 n=2 Tax=Engraulis encrasicolus TaxID=184585 RepID=UPI002FD726E5
MDNFADMSEDELTDYVLQLSIQESCQDAFLSSKDSSNASSNNENVKLLAAIKTGDVSGVQEVQKSPSAFLEADGQGWLPLHWAAIQPIAKVLEAVLNTSCGPKLQKETNGGETCLTLAVEAELEENVRVLLEYGACPYITNSKNESALLLAVRKGAHGIVHLLLSYGAPANQICDKKWTALHEAAQKGHADIITLLLRWAGQEALRDEHGVTPLGIAAENGHEEIMQILIDNGADVNAQAYNGESVMMEAARSGNPDCIRLLLAKGGDPNLPNVTGYLPIHRAAIEGHYLALKTLIAVTSRLAIRLSGQSPVHSAAQGSHAECLELLINYSFDVNRTLSDEISENYSDMRRSALYFSVSNGDVTCTEMLLNAGAKTNLDPLSCLLVAVRAGRYEIVKLLLAKRADVNCYFTVVNDTVFPTALQYCLQDEVMMRLLLNNGYQAEKCFSCHHDDTLDMTCKWKLQQGQRDGDESKLHFCEIIGLACLAHLSGRVVQVLLDYVGKVHLCSHLRRTLRKQSEWGHIRQLMCNPRPLKHLCRLKIRKLLCLSRLCDTTVMDQFPPRIKHYLLFKENDVCEQLSGVSA